VIGPLARDCTGSCFERFRAPTAVGKKILNEAKFAAAVADVYSSRTARAVYDTIRTARCTVLRNCSVPRANRKPNDS